LQVNDGFFLGNGNAGGKYGGLPAKTASDTAQVDLP